MNKSNSETFSNSTAMGTDTNVAKMTIDGREPQLRCAMRRAGDGREPPKSSWPQGQFMMLFQPGS